MRLLVLLLSVPALASLYGCGGCSATTNISYPMTSPPNSPSPSPTPLAVIDSTSPPSGAAAGGATITITGSGFSSSATATVGGQACTSPVVSEAGTSITCTAPAHAAGTVDIAVTNPGANPVSKTNAFTYLPAPTIVSMSPDIDSITDATQVTLTGSGFLSTTTVSFGTTSCGGVSVNTDQTQLTCTMSGTLAGDGGRFLDSGAKDLYPTPLLSTLPVGSRYGSASGGNTITLNGSFFRTGTTVSVGGNACTGVNIVSSTQLTCTAPSGTPGTADVVVTNPVDSKSATLASAYNYYGISSVSPTAGPAGGGTTLTISGANIPEDATVSVGGQACATAPTVSASSITCVLQSHAAGAVDVIVTKPSESPATSAGAFTYYTPLTIDSVSPTSGPISVSRAITITGTGFKASADVSVTIGGSACTGVSVNDAKTSLTCNGPATATPGDAAILVTNSGELAVSAGDYTYYTPVTIASVSPTSGPISVSRAITITGTGFKASADVSVTIGGSACTGVSVNDAKTSLTCNGPATATPGTAAILVTNSGQLPVSAGDYTYYTPATISSVSPTTGPVTGGATMTLSGTHFVASGIEVTVGGNACSVTAASSTQVTCTIPAADDAGAVAILLTNAGQLAVSGGNYTYYHPATVGSVSPTSGPIAGGTSITISGTHFLDGASVSVGGQSCTSAPTISENSITCTVPAHAVGSVDISVQNPAQPEITAMGAYYYYTAPTISSTSPTGGATVGGALITINGTGFYYGSDITVGGTTCGSITAVSTTKLTCIAPAHAAGTVDIVVTNSGLAPATQSSAFAYVSSPTNVTLTSPAGGIDAVTSGTNIVLSGIGFVGTNPSGASTTTISFGDTSCTNVVVSADQTQLTCTMSAAPSGDGRLAVSGTGSGEYPTPLLSGLASGSETGTTFGGHSITINGSYFRSGATVSLGGQDCPVSSVNAAKTQIVCTTPARAAASAVDVVVTNPDNKTASLNSAYAYAAHIYVAQDVDFGKTKLVALRLSPTNGQVATIGTPLSVSSSGKPLTVAVHPTFRKLYAGFYLNGIQAFPLSATGTPSIAQLPVSGGDYNNPVSIVINPAGTYLYAANKSTDAEYSGILKFTINQTTGNVESPVLYPVEVDSAGLTNASKVAINPAGTYAFAAFDDATKICSLSISAVDGALTKVGCYDAPANPKDIGITANGNFLYMVGAGATTVAAYKVDADGSLKKLDGTALAGVPTTIAINSYDNSKSPTGANALKVVGNDYLYVANVNDSDRHAAISLFTISGSGDLTYSSVAFSPTPVVTAPVPSISALAIDPTGKYLYASDRSRATGYPSSIYAYTIGSVTHALDMLATGGTYTNVDNMAAPTGLGLTSK